MTQAIDASVVGQANVKVNVDARGGNVLIIDTEGATSCCSP